MAKINIPTITNSADMSVTVNAAIQKLVSELNDKVLYRDNPAGEYNGIHNDIDFNGYDLLNVGNLDGSKVSIAGTPLYEVLENAVYQVIVNPDDPFEVHPGIERFVTTTVNPDTLESSGWYYTANIGAAPILNAAGWILVFARGSAGVPMGYTLQLFIPHNGPLLMFLRTRTDGGAWTAWEEVGDHEGFNLHVVDNTAHNIPAQITTAKNELLAVTNALDARLDVLELDHILITVNTGSIVLSDTPQTIMGATDIAVNGIVRNPDGSITYPDPGRYVVSFTCRLSVTNPTTLYVWLEKYNTTTLVWDPLPNSGFMRSYGNASDWDISHAYMRMVTVPNETYRIRASKAASGAASFATGTLPNGVVMPSFRVDIRN